MPTFRLNSSCALRDSPSQAWVEKSVTKLTSGQSSEGSRYVTLDDIAARAAGSKKPAVLTSPRSIKVCLEHGIDPAMLVPKAVSDFATPGLSLEHQRVKWEHYEDIRLERLEVLNEARHAMDPSEAAPTAQLSGFSTPTRLRRNPSSSTVGSSPGSFGGESLRSTALKEEQRRLEAVRRRAEKRIAAMEVARERLEQRQMLMEEKVRRAAEAEQERATAKAIREREKQRVVFERAQAKKAADELELKQQQREMERRFRENEANRRRKEAQERAERVAKQRAEKEKKKKLVEFKQQTDAILEAQQAEILRKRELMERRDTARQAFIEEEKHAAAAASERRRQEFERRREEAKARGEQVLEIRRQTIMEKAAQVHQRQLVRAQNQDQERMHKAAQSANKALYQQQVYAEAQAIREEKIEAILMKEQREEERVRRIQERKLHEAAEKSLKKSMSVEERREKVECMKRYKEYQNAQLMDKIERDTARAKAVLAAKEELRKNRAETNRLLTLQRERLMQEMNKKERARSARSGRVSIGGSRPGSRPQSAHRERPRSAMR